MRAGHVIAGTGAAYLVARLAAAASDDPTGLWGWVRVAVAVVVFAAMLASLGPAWHDRETPRPRSWPDG